MKRLKAEPSIQNEQSGFSQGHEIVPVCSSKAGAQFLFEALCFHYQCTIYVQAVSSDRKSKVLSTGTHCVSMWSSTIWESPKVETLLFQLKRCSRDGDPGEDTGPVEDFISHNSEACPRRWWNL